MNRQLSYKRIPFLINEAISLLDLDLCGKTILTEGATGLFAATPVIASLAGGKVFAVTKDSKFGKAADAERDVSELAKRAGVKGEITFLSRDKIPFDLIDIVTNLGFVRPIDKDFVSRLKKGSAISYMAEAWEFREGDIDLDACKKRGIPVVSTNESAPEIRVFEQVGHLAIKLLLDIGLEVFGNRIGIYSPDPFGTAIKNTLDNFGAISFFIDAKNKSFPANLDAVIACDYKNSLPPLNPKQLKNSGSPIIFQFCGAVDFNELSRAGYCLFPETPLESGRMSFTLAELGPRPLIYLHTAGLKAGEVISNCLENNLSYEIERQKHPVCGKEL
ncbi:MAG: hypothetical protein Kow0090_05930 [Myxococcota bacterium]